MTKYTTLKQLLLLFAITSTILSVEAQSFDGTKFYRLTTQWQGEGKSLDVINDGSKNNQLQLANTGNFSGQSWKITLLQNGYYRLTTQWQGENKSLDVVNDGKNNKIQLAGTAEVSGQYWKISPLGDGYYRLSNLWQGDGKSLDVLNDGTNNQLQLNDTGNYSGQYWKITDLSGSNNATLIPTKPPFHGTIFVSPDILKASDPTAFSTLTDAGQAERTMFDRRQGADGAFVSLQPYLFKATYQDNLSIEMQVNPEFGSVENARKEARKYAEVIGRLPTVLRKDVKTSWIHQGDKLFGGGNNNILIHTGQAAAYERDGILEEALIHEGAHSSLDAAHALAKGWVAAQKADPVFISSYAQENPQREDIAESFIFFLALQYRGDRMTKELKETIKKSIPQRMAYFKQQNFKVYPWK